MLRNTTNIPDRLVAIAAAFVIPKLPDGSKPPVAAIIIKNKVRGKINGQWGWYYPDDQKVVCIIPRNISHAHHTKLRVTKRPITISSRAEFLVSILAHELRHAWQFIVWDTPASKWRLEHTKLGKMAREVDAEMYQLEMLRKWRHEIESLLTDTVASST